MPRITVLMTVYNGSKYLRPSLEAVLNQTFKDFEFLIINDCSTDDSLEIIHSCNDPRIVIHNNEKNLGQTRSLNVGLEKAKAKYIARMDADDLAYPRWLDEQNKYITAHEVSVVTTKAAVIDTQGRLKRILNSPDTFEEMLLESMFSSPVNHVGSLFNKQDALSVGGYNEEMVISADFSLWSKMLHKGFKFATTSEILIAIRFHDQSASATKVDKEMKESSGLMARNMAWLTGLALSEEDALLLWQWIYRTAGLSEEQFIYMLKAVNRAYKSVKKEFSISSDVIQRVRVAQSKTVFVKKIFGCIKDGKTKEIVRLCDAYKIYVGNDSLFFWIAAWAGLGGRVLKILPFAYEKMSQWKAWGRMRLCF